MHERMDLTRHRPKRLDGLCVWNKFPVVCVLQAAIQSAVFHFFRVIDTPSILAVTENDCPSAGICDLFSPVFHHQQPLFGLFIGALHRAGF